VSFSFEHLEHKHLIPFCVSLTSQTLGFVVLGGVKVHALNVTGLVINTFGGVWYSYAKYTQKKKMPRKIAPDEESHPHK
jgi:solute carrier family 35 protein